MSDYSQIIDNIVSGETSLAKDAIENALSAKAFSSLESRKQNIATTLYGGEQMTADEMNGVSQADVETQPEVEKEAQPEKE